MEELEKNGLYEPLIAFLVRWRNHLRSGGSQDLLEQTIPCACIVNREVVLRRRRDLLEAVDTSLLKCYQMTNIARIRPLLRQENYCSLEVTETILKASGCLKDLITVYKMRGLHREALQCLTSVELNYHDLAKYLRHLDDAPFDFVAEFGETLLANHPRLWMNIFLAWECQIRQRLASLSKEDYYSLIGYRDKAIRYLERVAPHLILPFLECVIFNSCNCDTAEEEGLDALDMLQDDISTDDSFSPSSSPLDSSRATRRHWESTCVWPFPRQHRFHSDSPDAQTMPNVCTLPSGFEPQVELFDRYVKILM